MSWVIHPGHAGQASASGSAVTTTHVLAGPPWTGPPPPGTSDANPSPNSGPPWT
ncbi:MAG TPA: hypothetical protein VGH27_27850 [Streptosporangiaceae bacterium]